MIHEQKRVLLVDNNPDTLRSLANTLDAAGYMVFAAESAARAREILAYEIIHEAVVDKALEKEEWSDTSGFDFAQELPDYIPRIILTAFEDKASIRRALGENVRAQHSLQKQE